MNATRGSILPLLVLSGWCTCLAQPGVFTVGVPQDSMVAILIGDTVEAPWQGTDTYAFDPDNDGVVDLLVKSYHYVGGLGSGRSLSVLCGDSTLLATTTAIDSADAVFGGPDTVPVPQQFALGELTNGNELFTNSPFLNSIAYSSNPGAYTSNMHAWRAVVDGYVVYKKWDVGGEHYGWLRIDTYGPQSAYAVVQEIGYQALALPVQPMVPAIGNVLAWTGDALLVSTWQNSVLCITDAAGRRVFERDVAVGAAQRVVLPQLLCGVYCAALRSAQGEAVLRFAAVGR